ncbi:hypothetical protein V1506DRAFT_506696 [Lipomyces tetrasporus]
MPVGGRDAQGQDSQSGVKDVERFDEEYASADCQVCIQGFIDKIPDCRGGVQAYLKNMVVRQYMIVKPDIFAQALLNTDRHGQAYHALEKAKRQQQDILRISNALMELAQLMEELMAEVQREAEDIQHIELMQANVQRDGESGVQHLDKAVSHAWSARRKKWILLGIIALILIIIPIASYYIYRAVTQ